MINIGNFLHPNLIVDLETHDRESSLRRLLEAVARADVVADPKAFAEQVFQRESQGSTAIGMGVAIPHVRLPELPELFITLGRHRHGLNYNAPDGAPVNLIFLIGATGDQQQYLKLIMRISWLVRNAPLRKQMLEAPTTESLFELLRKY